MQTETLALTATPLANGYVKAKTGDDTTDAVYQEWYKAVYLPTAEDGGSDTPAVASEPAKAKVAAASADTASALNSKSKA